MAIASQLQLRRGTTAQHAVFTGAPGEITVDTDKKTVVVHDGSTPGGFPVDDSSVVSTGSGVARLVSDRFAEHCNVKDYGATGDGVTDDWLAIQRAIAAAGGHPVHGADVMNKNVPANTETTLTSGTPFTFDWGGKTIPSLFYTDKGDRVVYFPAGVYRISRPLVIGPGTKLVGDLGGGNGPIICPTVGSKGQFNLIESYFVWLNRTQCENNVPWQISGGYDNNIVIEGLQLVNNYGSPYAVPPVLVNQLAWYRMPFGNYGVGGPSFDCTANATAGNDYFTPTGNSFFHQYYPGQKIKFTNHATVYTYVKRTSNQIFVTPNITQNVSGANVLIGLPANNGILINGGENAVIRRCYVNSFEGAGIFVLGGTPGPVIAECMVNWCDIAFWADAGTNLLLQPSGDGNNTFLRTGFISAGSTTMIGCKVEGKHSPAISAGNPYVSGTDARSGIELANWGTVSNSFVFIGGTWNYHGADATWGLANAKSHAFITCWRESFMPKVAVYGMRGGGFRETFYKQLSTGDPNETGLYPADRILKRRDPYDYDDITTIQGTLSLDYIDDTNFDRVSGAKINHRIYSPNSGLSDFAFFGDQGSGFFDGVASFSRTGTTATFTTYATDGVTLANHNLQVGDQLKAAYPTGVTPLTLDSNPANRGAYGSLYVKSVPTSSTFTVEVAASGGSSGSGVRLQISKTYWLHGIFAGEHIVQLPTDVPVSNELINGTQAKVAFSVQDKQRNRLAGLRAGIAKLGEWWASSSLNVGGTIATPHTSMLTKEVTLSGLSGATVTATAFIPAGAIVLGVTAWVTTAITGATSFDIGDGTDADLWGNDIAVALNTYTTSASFTGTSVPIYPTQTNVVLTANGSNFTGGAVKLVLHYIRCNITY